MAVYNIKVETGDRKGAGTSATVTIKITGTMGETGAVKFGKVFHNDFGRNQTNEYTVKADDVGDLLMITLTRSSGIFHSDWFVNEVTITKTPREDDVVYTFPCFRWVVKELVVFEGKDVPDSNFEDVPQLKYFISGFSYLSHK